MQEETDIMPVRQYLELGPYNGPPIDDKFLSDLNKLTQKQRFECLSCTPTDVLDAITKYSPDISCSGCIRTLKESLGMGVLPHGERVSELLRAVKDGSISLHPHLARDTTSTARVFALCHKPGYLGSRCGTKRNRCSIHAANPRVEHGWHTLWEMMPLPIKMNTAFLRLQDIQDSLGKHLKGLFLCRDCRGNVLKAMDLLKGVVDPRDIPLDEVHDRLCFQPFRKLYFGTCVDRIGQALHEHNNRPSVSHTLAHVGEHVLQGAVEDDVASQEGAHQHGHAQQQQQQQQHSSNTSSNSGDNINSNGHTSAMPHSSGHTPHSAQQQQQHTSNIQQQQQQQQRQPKNRNKKQKTMDKEENKEYVPDGTGLPQLEEGDEDDEDDYEYEDEEDEYDHDNHDCCEDGCCGDEEHEHEYDEEGEEHDDDCCCSEDCVECCAEAGELPLSLSSQWPFNVPDSELMPTSSPWLWDMDSTTTAINAGADSKQVVPKAMGWGGGCVHGSDMTVVADDDGAGVSVVRACGCAATHIAVALDYVPTLIASALEADERDELARSKGLSSDRHAPTVKDGQFELVNCIGKVLLSRMRDAWVRSLETKQTELMLLWLALDCMRTNVEHVMHQSALTELLEEEENEVGKAERARTKKKRKKKAKSDRVAAAVAEALTKAEKEADDEAERKRELKQSKKKKKNKNKNTNTNSIELVKSLEEMNLDNRIESDMHNGNSKYSAHGWSQAEEDRVLSQMGWLDENQTTGTGSSSSSSSTSSSSPGTSNDKPSALLTSEIKNGGLFPTNGGDTGSDLFSNMSSDNSDDHDHPEHDAGDDYGEDDGGGLTMEELREAKAKLQNMTVGTIGSSREELRAKLRRRFESLCK